MAKLFDGTSSRQAELVATLPARRRSQGKRDRGCNQTAAGGIGTGANGDGLRVAGQRLAAVIQLEMVNLTTAATALLAQTTQISIVDRVLRKIDLAVATHIDAPTRRQRPINAGIARHIDVSHDIDDAVDLVLTLNREIALYINEEVLWWVG
ncbi:hypothetical protein D3C79_640950 [compost metagenome]